MPFDPDAYLASQPPQTPESSTSGFDPDAYLASKPNGPSPGLWDSLKLAGKMPGPFPGDAWTPWGSLGVGLQKAGQATAESVGAAGFPKTGAALGTGIQMLPDLAAGYAALPAGVQAGIEREVPNILSKASGEVGGGFADAAQTGGPVMGPKPATQPILDPNYLQRTGGAGLNAQMGIRGSTIQQLTPRGQNPGRVGIQLAQDLQNEGASSSDQIQSWDNLKGLLDNGMAKLNSIKQQIADEAAKYGTVENPTEVDADKALKPLYDAWNSHAKNITGVGKDTADYLGNIHKSLSDFADTQGGKLTYDHIDQALGEVGPLTHKGALDSQAMNQEAYHALADTRDEIVQQIGKQSKNPSFARDLQEANKTVSRILRIMPDASRAAANAATGQKNMAQIFSDLQNSLINRGGMSIGSSIPSTSQIAGAGRLTAPVVSRILKPGEETP